MKIEKCRSCGALVVWLPVRDPKPGKKNIQIVNAESVLDPDLIIGWKCSEVGSLRRLDEMKDFYYDHETMISHFATCPQAEQWRGKKNV
jgi:hypothetical protein